MFFIFIIFFMKIEKRRTKKNNTRVQQVIVVAVVVLVAVKHLLQQQSQTENQARSIKWINLNNKVHTQTAVGCSGNVTKSKKKHLPQKEGVHFQKLKKKTNEIKLSWMWRPKQNRPQNKKQVNEFCRGHPLLLKPKIKKNNQTTDKMLGVRLRQHLLWILR